MKLIGYFVIGMLLIQGFASTKGLILENIVSKDLDVKTMARALVDSKTKCSSKTDGEKG